jgi:hypothetical protein
LYKDHAVFASRQKHCFKGVLRKYLSLLVVVMGDLKQLVPAERIENVILFMRGEKVIADSDLAALYGVTTKRLNKEVKRNRGRFPADFMF